MRILPHRRRSERAISVGAMGPEHLDEVLAIEEAVFSAPWSCSLYRDELAIADTRIYLVAIEDGRVIGYIGIMFVVDEAHVTTVAVAAEHQGRAIGKLLLYHGMSRARASGAKAATLEVRVSNAHAQSLYHQFGFVPAGIRKNYYADINEDGLVMWSYDLDGEVFDERLARIRADLEARALPLPEPARRRGRR
jgi:ribosomal-protein-alanine N-acetyltransferase